MCQNIPNPGLGPTSFAMMFVMVFLFPICFTVISAGMVDEPFDIGKYKSLFTITEHTKVVDITMKHNRRLQSSSGNATSFTYPVGCSPTRRRFLEQYCVVGTYTTSGSVSIDLDLYIYDANDNTKTVLLGITAWFKDGSAAALSSRASGCADLVDQTLSYGSLRAIVHACMSGGGTGKYNPVTKQFTILSNISTNVILRGFGRDLLNDKYTVTGYYYSGGDFGLGMNASVGSQMKKEGLYAGNLNFGASFSTVANNLFAWHTFAGVSSSAQLLDFRPAYASYPFVDVILNVKP
ncbi:hypothetical protein FOL47_010219 [Perkinsus chesapeaki]|uniref:Uncharacterized protein n=1 Tax=Perkinsus chesapeaki TaxID=330153 RepID=A0A7J6L4N2_PERCH|nr:hypothetical protein FOL47_010219 [Perkinsus chesapeaki]